jgi:hypothetical protein
MAQTRSTPGLSRYGRLAAALAIPLVGLAALAVIVAISHRPTATPGPNPIGVTTPTPLPTPTAYPELFPDSDQFSLLAPNAFGPLTAPQATTRNTPGIDMTLAASPVGLPTQLPVWLLTSQPLNPRDVAERFGISGDATSVDHGVARWQAGLRVDPATATIFWWPAGVAAPKLGGYPRDSISAEVLAMRWLLRSGLAPFAGTPARVEQTSNGDRASLPEWTVTWPRIAPNPPGTPAIDQVVARVSGDGTLKQLDFTHPHVAKGSTYTLRPWQEAFQDAQRGHWYRQCCRPLPELTTPGVVHVTITSVSVEYDIVQQADGLYAIPMYAFTEGPGYDPGLVPAIAP